MKTGRLSRGEMHFIEENAEKLTVEQMAEKLDRSTEPIINHLHKTGKTFDKKKSISVQAEYDLRSKPFWKELKLQFSDNELDMFLYHWKEIISQFRKDIMPTEEMQIIDTIKLEILMNRTLRERQASILRKDELEIDLRRLRDQPRDQQSSEQIFNIERQIASLTAAQEALSRDYKELQTKKAAMFKDLKATREQRIQKLESNKTTLAGLIDKILRDPEFFEEQGKYLEKMRLAMEQEKKRLGDYHKYEDGGVDRPLLNAETVAWSE